MTLKELENLERVEIPDHVIVAVDKIIEQDRDLSGFNTFR